MRKWEKDFLAARPPTPDNIEEFYDAVPLPDGHELPLKVF
jgi:hypothetical protein